MANIARRRPRVPGFGVDRFFNDPFFRSPLRGVWGDWPSPSKEATASLPVDITETDEELTVKASLPGYREDEVSVLVDDGVLTIAAAHSAESTMTDGVDDSGDAPKYIRRERSYGAVRRSFTLPTDQLDGDLKARLSNGVLTVHVPKAETPRPTTIAIEVVQD